MQKLFATLFALLSCFGIAPAAAQELLLNPLDTDVSGYIRPGNGTVIDRSTGLVWLEKPNCLANRNWQAALDTVRVLAQGNAQGCVLTDGSHAGEWRLPNINELTMLTDFGRYRQALAPGNPMAVGYPTYSFWSSTTQNRTKTNAWVWERVDGHVRPPAKSLLRGVMPVRDTRPSEMPLLRINGDITSFTSIKLLKGENIRTMVHTGQTACYSQTGVVIPCAGTGQDGELRRGFKLPGSRFADSGNGTVLDRYTEQYLLKDANCLRPADFWNEGMARIAAIGSGSCGLIDGSQPGDWRAPTAYELQQLVAWNVGGPTQVVLEPGHPFRNLLSLRYWSGTKTVFLQAGQEAAWAFVMGDGSITTDTVTEKRYLWAIRNGEPAEKQLDCAIAARLGATEWLLSCARYGKTIKLRVQDGL